MQICYVCKQDRLRRKGNRILNQEHLVSSCRRVCISTSGYGEALNVCETHKIDVNITYTIDAQHSVASHVRMTMFQIGTHLRQNTNNQSVQSIRHKIILFNIICLRLGSMVPTTLLLACCTRNDTPSHECIRLDVSNHFALHYCHSIKQK